VEYVFADHVLDSALRELRRDAEAVAVEPQVFDLLLYLIQNRNRVISKDDLIANIWRGRIVSESTLNSRINAVRKAVGDDGESQTLIRTVPRKGVRFVAAVREQAIGKEPGVGGAVSPVEQARAGSLVPDRPALAVLPFVNMTENPHEEGFCDGLTEDLITALSSLRRFFVVARSSSFTYKGRTVHLKQVAQELRAHYVIEGSVRRCLGRLRVSVRLNDAASGRQIWVERYDRDGSGDFRMSDEIVELIVPAIEPLLHAVENARATFKPAEALDARGLTMRALSHYWQLTRQDNKAAQALLECATAIDPGYGQALGVLASSHMLGVHMGWTELKTAAPMAEEAALAGIRADSDDPWAHHGLAMVHLFTRRFEDARSEFEITLQLNPNFLLARGFCGLLTSYYGRREEANAVLAPALQLDLCNPFSALYRGIAGYVQFTAHNYEEAIRLAQESIHRRGDLRCAHRVLVAASGMSGHEESGAAAAEELRRIQPNVSLAWMAERIPMMRAADQAHYFEGFRRAGLQ
jgi:TolB-like protein